MASSGCCCGSAGSCGCGSGCQCGNVKGKCGSSCPCSGTFQAQALAAFDTGALLHHTQIARRKPLAHDVLIEILYSGICHSDLHMIRGEWQDDYTYPMVPGHEIAGVVAEVGSAVTKFKVGDPVGVGVFVGCCEKCENCLAGEQQYCDPGMHTTYNFVITDKDQVHLHNHPRGELTYGGYSSHITVNEAYTFRIPDNIPLERAAPLLCAGITTYSPLRHFGRLAEQIFKRKDLNVAVIGFGGLGHMAVKFAKQMGYKVFVVSSSKRKQASALHAGAEVFIDASDERMLKTHKLTFHLAINTVSAEHDVSKYLEMLDTDGIMVVVGLPPNAVPLRFSKLIEDRRILAGSVIGNAAETQEMLDFCGQHNIAPDVELIEARDANKALYQLSKNASKANRYVIRTKDTLVPGDWEVDPEPKINPRDWAVHPKATVTPAEANIHAAFSSTQGQAGKSSKAGMHVACYLGTAGLALGALGVAWLLVNKRR